jgi:hypothetical protein
MASVIVALSAVALPGAYATNEALSMTMSTSTTLASMRRFFVRSDEVHHHAMDSISRKMSTSAAWQVLEQHNQTTPALLQFARRALHKGKAAKSQKSLLRGKTTPVQSYGSFQPALDLLNSMIYESMRKYDAETAKCTDYYSQQCGYLETVRGEISVTNYKAATCREHTLAAQTQIELSENKIPDLHQELDQHDLKCKHEVYEMQEKLKIIQGDVEVLTSILQMTQCSSLLQLDLLHCEDKCNKQRFVSVDHEGLQGHLAKLKSSVAIGLVQQGLSELSASGSDMGGMDELDSEDDPTQNATILKPVSRTVVPDSPCTDPYQGGPTPLDKRAAKCSVSSSPECNKIQERFLLMQSEIQDENDDLSEEITKLQGQCERTVKNIHMQMGNEEQTLRDEQTKLATSMTCEANAGEQGRLANKDFESAHSDLKSMMKTCSANYIQIETELCGLKKIRGELYKMNNANYVAFFQDCVVSPWEAQECSNTCGGGTMNLVRTVSTQPVGGSKCLPLAEMKSCNDNPCPVDCVLDGWTGWSRCSAECGGGVEQRLRDVKRNMKYNGKPCGQTSETRACNVQSCESDCELSDWGPWSQCSKQCDDGTKKRQKFVKKEAEGQGNCADMWDGSRLQYASCNSHSCDVPASGTMTCTATMDVVILLDGSGSLGDVGWAAEIKAAEALVAAFDLSNTGTQIALILFSGPSTFQGILKCFGKGTGTLNLKDDCKINMVSHFTKDLGTLQTTIRGLVWPKGSTLTSLALGAAKSELSLGRKDAKSVVIVITDGKPLSIRKTTLASRELRKAARLMWVPVTRFAPLASIKKWATRRWEENIVPVKDFDQLTQPSVINSVIADMCPPMLM